MTHFPGFVRAFGGISIQDGTLELADGGGALRIAPGAEPDETALMAAVEASVSASRHEDILAVFEAMGCYHPDAPRWVLPMMGVVPIRQGQGIGSALLRPVLDRCDAEGVAAYLEATTERSRALYARFGFAQMDTIRVADCPPIDPMVRRPR